MGVDVDAVRLAVAAGADVGHDDGGAHGIDPDLVGLGHGEVGAAELDGGDKGVAQRVVEAEVAVLGRGGEVADGTRVVVADAEVEAEAVADGEGENVGADGDDWVASEAKRVRHTVTPPVARAQQADERDGDDADAAA